MACGWCGGTRRPRAPFSPRVARRRARFGDGTLYVERLIERPRHIEIQIFADDHDHVMSLFERECSLQRRHQKIVEESPSPAVTPEIRREMSAAAVAAARAAGYRNAGTIEFLLEETSSGPRFYFLEMNTRLQVEHPVTEQVVGLDLVRAQLMVAAGQALPWKAEQLRQRGHAIECRVYAEDPASGFLPQAGPLRLYREPSGPGVRVDSGVREGDAITVHYDPLIAKVIVSAESRATALARLARALREFPILGIAHQHPVPGPPGAASRRPCGTDRHRICRARDRVARRRRPRRPARRRRRDYGGARDARGPPFDRHRHGAVRRSVELADRLAKLRTRGAHLN